MNALVYTQPFLHTAEGTNWKLFSGILAAIIILLIVGYDVYLYRRHKDGVFHWIRFSNCSCHRKGKLFLKEVGFIPVMFI